MKRLTIFVILSLVIFLVSITGANAFQKTILLNKSCQSIPGLIMKQVTITEDKTVVDFEWENAEGNWAISIYAPENDSAFVIKDKRIARTYRLRSAEGIATYPNKLNIKEGDVKKFTLVFDKMPYACLNVLEETAELLISAVYQ